MTGYARLDVFKWRLFFSWFFAGVLGGSLMLTLASLFRFRDTSIVVVIPALLAAAGGMLLADAKPPQFVDPVYGEGGLFRFPWYIDPLIPIVMDCLILFAVLYTLRFLVGKLCSSSVG